MNPYADWPMKQVREQAIYLRGYQAGLQDAIKWMPALVNTKVHEQARVAKDQRALLHDRYEAILAERRERRKP